MPYHVLIKRRSNNANDIVKLDLTLDQLQERILKPYSEGRGLFMSGISIPLVDIDMIRITETQETSSQLRPLAEEIRGKSGQFPTSLDWYIAEFGRNVTDELIVSPPSVQGQVQLASSQPLETPNLMVTEPTQQHALSAPNLASSVVNSRNVFVVHGRNAKARDAMFTFLRSIGLHPVEWSEAVLATGKGTPYIGDVLDQAFAMSQVVVVLMTPDDAAVLQAPYRKPNDPPYEASLTSQARPNVLFEAGMAVARSADRTVIVEMGTLRSFSDIGGRHIIKLDNTVAKRQELAQRLRAAGCPVNLIGTDWHTAGNFDVILQEEIVNTPDEQFTSRQSKEPLPLPKHDNQNGQFPTLIVGGLLGFGLGVLGNLIAAWIQQDVIQNSFNPLSIVIIIALTISGVVIGAQLQSRLRSSWPPGKGIYWLLTAVVVGILALAVVLVIILGGKMREPATVYLVIDATSKMQPIFGDVRNAVQLSTSLVQPDARIGMRIYGGNRDSSTGCQDTRQLLPTDTYEKVNTQLDTVLETVQPSGNGSLTGAVLESIYTDLANETRPVQLIVITSGTNSLCDPLGGGILEGRAKDVQSDLTILLVSIGEISTRDTNVLDSYAKAFHGRHVHIASAESLPIIVQRASYYGYGYYTNDASPDNSEATPSP